LFFHDHKYDRRVKRGNLGHSSAPAFCKCGQLDPAYSKLGKCKQCRGSGTFVFDPPFEGSKQRDAIPCPGCEGTGHAEETYANVNRLTTFFKRLF
jgi:DnaJ-class molecular chaperone